MLSSTFMSAKLERGFTMPFPLRSVAVPVVIDESYSSHQVAEASVLSCSLTFINTLP